MKFISNSLKVASVLFLFLIVASCGSDDDDGPATAPIRTADDVRADFQNLTINVGVNDLTLESIVAGQFWNFRIIVPASASSTNKVPLVFRLHGGATGTNVNAHKTTDCLVEPGFATMDAIIVSPNSNGIQWYEELNIVQVLALVEMVTVNLDVDATRTVVMGYSDGGNAAFFFSQYYSSLFTAAIPMATSYATSSQSGVVHQFAKPIYAIHGSDDELFSLATTQGYIDDSVAAGSDITFVVADGLTHFNSCDYVPYLQNAVAWLENTVWD
ncbi:MAG: dienelactone hydrolase family protein [Urechidicola sp.]|nr:dienelactone hydrolase family protein [Urechidicola sp.]